MKTLTDEQDRERSFVYLYEQHYGAILAYARRRVEESAARDVTADVFLVAWRRLDEAVAGGLPWLYRTAQLTLKNWQRGQRRSARTAARLASLPAQAASPDPAVTHTERQQLLDALRSMPEKDRELLLLIAWEQLHMRSAAAVVGCSVGAAGVRLHRARRRLRRLLPRPDSDDVPLTLSTNPEMTR